MYNHLLNDFGLLIFFVTSYIVIYYFYYFNTKFSHNITVKKDFLHGHHKNIYNVVLDDKGNTYVLENKYLLLKFNSTENISKISKNEQYKIKGYGIRIPFLDLYPVILDVSLL